MDLLGLFRRDTPGVEEVTQAATGRRERVGDAGSAELEETLSAKLLHGWLQNCHQTLVPLTLNLSLLTEEQQERLAKVLASILLAGRPAEAAAEAAPAARGWLSRLGAGSATLAAFDAAMGAPLPLNVVFETTQASGLTIYAYVAALMASDARYPVSLMLCDVVQSRFGLPAALVRSAVRRYRR